MTSHMVVEQYSGSQVENIRDQEEPTAADGTAIDDDMSQRSDGGGSTAIKNHLRQRSMSAGSPAGLLEGSDGSGSIGSGIRRQGQSAPRLFPHQPKIRNSIFTQQGHQGFLNLVGMLLCGWAGWIMLNEHKQTGRFINLDMASSMLRDMPVVLSLWILSMLWCILCAVTEEVLLSQYHVTELLVYPLFAAAQLLLLIVPTIVAVNRGHLMNPVLRACLMMQVIVNLMKHHSWYMSNRWIRKQRAEMQEKPGWHQNTPIRDLIKEYAIFTAMPTLVYEEKYPRRRTIKWMNIVKDLTACLICLLICYLIVQKHMLPYFEDATSITYVESIFLLGVPALFLWNMVFFIIFHCVLNVLAEITRFADKEFYLDWWNATSMDEFWNRWNRPVYRWMTRHIYVETQRVIPFYNKLLATLTTFLVTALLHEVILAVAFIQVRPFLFGLILAQIPYVYLTKMLRNTQLGNLLMWVGFVFFFPVLELYYAKMYNGKSQATA